MSLMAALTLILSGSPAFCDAWIPPDITPEEARLGRQAVQELERQFKVLQDHPDLNRLNGIVARLLPFTERPKVLYQVKVIDDREPNALALPGGHLYLTTGLLSMVRSDDELAAVLAHEVAHISRFHAIRMIRKESRLSVPALVALIGAVLSRGETGAEVAQMVGVVIQILRLGYSRDMEREADEVAFVCLQKAGFNPVGLLTFLEQLQKREEGSPAAALLPGYWTTHPSLEDRVATIKAFLKKAGIAIHRRPVTRALALEAKEIEVNGRQVTAVVLSGEELFRMNGADGLSSEQRAQRAVEKLDAAFNAGARPFHFRYSIDEQGLTIWWDRDILVRLTCDDLQASGQTPAEMARHLSLVMTQLFLRERLKGAI